MQDGFSVWSVISLQSLKSLSFSYLVNKIRKQSHSLEGLKCKGVSD